MTISEFADAGGHDRRTIKRRVLANAIRPVGRRGIYSTYRPGELEALMADEETPKRTGERLTPYMAFERAHDGAIYAMGEALPTALKESLAVAGVKANGAKFDRLALELFKRLGSAIETDLHKFSVRDDDGGGVPSLMAEFDINKPNHEWPEAIKPIVARLAQVSETKEPKNKN